MTNPFSQRCFALLFLCLVGFALQHCKGGGCAYKSPGIDLDSDCVADTSDNCPFTYNPLQRDTDENLIGDACEADEETVSLVKEFPNLFLKKENTKDCLDYKVIGCHGRFLDLENLDEISADSLANPSGVFSSETGICSAFNPDAPRPPRVFCVTENDESHFSGYLTINPDLSPRLEPCGFLEDLSDSVEMCGD